MDTKSPGRSLRSAAAAVTGARHLRAGRNGQDAAAAWVSADGRRGAIVVCDGCGSGASSEVGARLGAQLALAALVDMPATTPVPDLAAAMRSAVLDALSTLLDALPGEREQVVHDYLLFTLIAAVVIDESVHVLAIGDGAYAIDGVVRELGPFADNMPPYLAYELLGGRAETHVETAPLRESVVIATDGAAEVGLAAYAADAGAFVRHPDALRRRLAVQAKGSERIEWGSRRVVRTPAALQDDGAVALLVRGGDA